MVMRTISGPLTARMAPSPIFESYPAFSVRDPCLQRPGRLPGQTRDNPALASSIARPNASGDVCLDPRPVYLGLYESRARLPSALFFCSGCAKARTQLSEEVGQAESRRRVIQLHQYSCLNLRWTTQAFMPEIVLPQLRFLPARKTVPDRNA